MACIRTITDNNQFDETMRGLSQATKAQSVAMGVLNAVTKSNPFVIIATAIAGLTGAFFLFSDKKLRARKK